MWLIAMTSPITWKVGQSAELEVEQIEMDPQAL